MSRNAPVPKAGPYAVGATNQKDGEIIPNASYAQNVNYSGLGNGVVASPEYVNHGWQGLRLFINVVTLTTGRLVVKVQTRDAASGDWVDMPLATTPTIAGTGTTTLTIMPGIAETANVDVADPLGVRWRVVGTVTIAAVEFSVGGDYLGG